MNISNRLLSICNLIDDLYVYDIGCDHALLDIYLTINKNIHCVAIDVNDTILNIARTNIQKYNLENKIDVIKGNGFDDLNLNYETTMILAGMGTSTITKIVAKNKTKTIICQTNTEQYNLRKDICNMGYYIEDENIIYENNRYYITIKFKEGHKSYTDEDYFLGPILRIAKSETFTQYVKNMYKKNYLGYVESLKYNNKDIKLYKMMEILKNYIS